MQQKKRLFFIPTHYFAPSSLVREWLHLGELHRLSNPSKE